MNTEQMLLEKWRILSPEKKQEVLDLLDQIYREEKGKKEVLNYQPKTELGKKLWEIRKNNIADPNVKLLDWDGIEAEIAQIRGSHRNYGNFNI